MRNWFAIVDLHLWMVIQRVRTATDTMDAHQGKRIERELLNVLTQDIERRLREFDVLLSLLLMPLEHMLTKES